MSLVERFNRTMWNYIKKWCTSKNTLTFYDQIPKFVKNYNNKTHSAINMKPIDAFLGRKTPINFWTGHVSGLKIGDNVRLLQKLATFAKKSFEQKWSEQIYEIVKKFHNRYKLKNVKTGQELKDMYLARKLQKVNKEVTSDEIQPDISKEVKQTTQKNTFVRRQKGLDLIANVNKDTGNIQLPKRLIPQSGNKLRVRKTKNSYLHRKNKSF